MFPLARSLLALAAAALLHAACASPECTTVTGGVIGNFYKNVSGFIHLDQTDSVTEIPEMCTSAPSPGFEEGVVVTACDPYGAAPQVELLDSYQQVHVTCTWTNGQLCPQGIDVSYVECCSAPLS